MLLQRKSCAWVYMGYEGRQKQPKNSFPEEGVLLGIKKTKGFGARGGKAGDSMPNKVGAANRKQAGLGSFRFQSFHLDQH